MKQTIKKLCLYWQAKKVEAKAIKKIVDLPMLKVVYKKDTSITLGCLTTGMSNSKPTLSWNSVELLVKNKTGDVRDFFKKVYKESKAKNISPQKYLDELAELTEKANLRRIALGKWANKFDSSFFNHLSGDVGTEKITIFFKELVYVAPKGQGGHWLNKFLKVDQVTFPPGISKVSQIADDVPFKAKVTIKSAKGKVFPKTAESSMFPKNWSKTRIQEEIAWVYENTVVKNINRKIKGPNDLFNKFEGDTTTGFKVLLEVDDLGKIVNAYPIII